ncbi:MAG: Eco57I restriction-modification methylase domain-containing protein [Cytophagaceae bacterium]|jgi:tRNA1(Val) A37 N6-methylase TrmN6|nr:Eco57I restriction-modification methylase domain-containing protein [Cytophagaceae bacterium]
MALSKQTFSDYIQQFKFRELFNDMGWDNDRTTEPIVVDNETYALQAVAQKHGFKILTLQVDIIPGYATRKKIENQVTKLFQEHLIIFFDAQKIEQIWQLAVRQVGKPTKLSETQWNKSQAPELLYQRAAGVFFEMDEEEHITIIDVKSRMAENFQQNNEKVTKAFYDKFKKEHTSFLSFIKGITERANQEWYASLMLNRLMFCYFIQKRGFLDKNKNYLRDKLNECKEKTGDGKFYSFYRSFLLVLFHKGLNNPTRTDEIQIEIGKIPYLNGGLFDEHEIECNHANIDIDDKAFENLFNFFDQYEWHLDTRNTASGKDINPDVIGYIFEKYINDRTNMGAYYTKEDITDYISKNCIIPYLFDEVARNNNLDNLIKVVVQNSGDKYIYEAVKKGAELELSAEIKTGIDTTLPNLRERRAAWNKPALVDYALPTEIWRETVARLQRYAEVRSKINNGEICTINDFITYNLNIRQFAQDVVENTNDPEFLKAFYKALTSVTILDPTCGSGAFLFAAMNILEPLYEACIMRMRAFVEDEDRTNTENKKNFSHKYKSFREILENIQSPQHPNLAYFIYKSIILNNLYGVDIMKEAVEIAKLRLFLKLVATVDADYKKDNLGLEPLPDIDFNIRAGNTLVGFATEKELENAFVGALDFDNDKGAIKEKCEIVAMAFQRYKEIQLKGQNENYADFKTAKDELNQRLKSLNNELNILLHKQASNTAYDTWQQTHQPFHWFAEFYEIINGNGGFDVIIGNPPYVVYTDASFDYKVKNYNTLSCANLYAYCSERSFILLKEIGRFGMIVPNSSISADKLNPLQKLFTKNKNSWISNYSWRPSKLFEGADMLLAIIISAKSANNKIYTSMYQKWYNEFREYLFENVAYNNASEILIEGSVPKISSNLYFDILSKLKTKTHKCLNSMFLNNSRHFLYYFRAVQYWVKILDKEPLYLDDGIQTKTGEMKPIFTDDENSKNALIAVLSSTTYFLHYITWASCQVINSRDFNFNFDINSIDNSLKEQLVDLGKKLQDDYQNNSHNVIRSYSKKGRTFTMEKQHFFIKLSKPIIDEIDTVLAEHYGFTEEELDFIINYDIKYRMGKELEDEE